MNKIKLFAIFVFMFALLASTASAAYVYDDFTTNWTAEWFEIAKGANDKTDWDSGNDQYDMYNDGYPWYYICLNVTLNHTDDWEVSTRSTYQAGTNEYGALVVADDTSFTSSPAGWANGPSDGVVYWWKDTGSFASKAAGGSLTAFNPAGGNGADTVTKLKYVASTTTIYANITDAGTTNSWQSSTTLTAAQATIAHVCLGISGSTASDTDYFYLNYTNLTGAAAPPADPNSSVNITAHSAYWLYNDSLTNFNVTIDGNYFTTSDGVIETNITVNDSQTMTVYANTDGHFQYVGNWNKSDVINISIAPWPIIHTHDSRSKIKISTFNVTFNSTIYTSNATGAIRFPRNTTEIFSVKSDEYFTKMSTFDMSLLGLTNFHEGVLNISIDPFNEIEIYDRNTSLQIKDFNVTINSTVFTSNATGVVKVWYSGNTDINFKAHEYFTSFFNRNLGANTVNQSLVHWPKITTYDNSTLSPVLTFNVTFNGSVYTSNGTTGELFFPANSSENVVFDANNYLEANITHDFIDDLNQSLEGWAVITAYNNWNGTQILDYNVTANVGAGTTTYVSSLVTGEVLIDSRVVETMTFKSPDHLEKVLQANLSNHLNTTLWQRVVNISAIEIISGTTVTAFNATVSAQGLNSTNTSAEFGESYVLFYLNDAQYNVTWEGAGYHNNTIRDLTFNSTFYNYTGTMWTSVLNITAVSAYTGTTVMNFTINYTSNTYNLTLQETTTSGLISLNLINDTGTLRLMGLNYTDTEFNLTVNETYQNYTVEVQVLNTVMFSFKNETNKVLLNNINVTMDLISTPYGADQSTLTGYLNFTLLIPADYVVRYRAYGYPSRDYFFTLTNNTYHNITLYLLNSSATQVVTATVYDEVQETIGNARIKTYRYDVLSNSYSLIEIAETNFEGEAQLNLDIGGEWYKFVIEYDDVTKLSTAPRVITGTDIEFRINLNDPVLENYYRSGDVEYTLNFSNVTDRFRFYYNDVNNVVSKGCLDVYRVTGLSRTFYNSSCVAGSSSTLYVNVANATGVSYEGQAYIYFNTDRYFLSSFIYKYQDDITSGNLGLFLLILLSLVTLLMARWNITVALIFFIMPTILLSTIGNIFISIDPVVVAAIGSATLVLILVMAAKAKW